MKYQYVFKCTDVAMKDVPDLQEMISAAKDIAWTTFTKNCDWQNVARSLGYVIGREEGLHINQDWHVGFYQSKWRGEKCFYIRWSAIEHVFLLPKEAA